MCHCQAVPAVGAVGSGTCPVKLPAPSDSTGFGKGSVPVGAFPWVGKSVGVLGCTHRTWTVQGGVGVSILGGVTGTFGCGPQCSVLADKVGISHGLDSMILEVFPNLTDPGIL